MFQGKYQVAIELHRFGVREGVAIGDIYMGIIITWVF